MRPTPYTIDRRSYSPSAEVTWKTTTHIPAEQNFRPLRDCIVVELQNRKMSDVIFVAHEEKPCRGKVLAVGPGCFLPRYKTDRWHGIHDAVPKSKRTAIRFTKRFRPTDVKVGDEVEFEPRSFDGFRWGDKYCLVIREEDVCGIRISEQLGEGPAPQRA